MMIHTLVVHRDDTEVILHSDDAFAPVKLLRLKGLSLKDKKVCMHEKLFCSIAVKGDSSWKGLLKHCLAWELPVVLPHIVCRTVPAGELLANGPERCVVHREVLQSRVKAFLPGSKNGWLNSKCCATHSAFWGWAAE